MAKVKTSDIIEEGLFKEPIESALSFKKALEEIEKQFKDTIEASSKLAASKPLDSYRNIKDVEAGINATAKAVEGLEAVEKERLKLEQKLLDLQSEQIQKNAELRVQIQEQTKANKEAAREKLGLISLYQKESARLNDLRKQYKELALQNKENTKEGKELLKNIQALDKQLKDIDAKVGQFQRSVGNYEKAVKGLSTAFKTLAASTGVIFLLEKLSGVFTSTTTGSSTLEKAIARVTVTLTVFVGSLFDAFSKLGSITDIFTSPAKTAELFSKSFEGFGDRVSKALEATDKAIDTNTRYAESVAGISAEIAKLSEEQAILEGIADDNTRSFLEQSEAGAALLEVSGLRAEKELQLLNLQKEAVAERRKAAREAGTINAEIEQQYADLLLQVADKRAEVEASNFAINKKRREDARDTAELELDILIDGFDTIKSVNERIIADQTKNLEKRRALLLQTQKDAEASFNEQIAIIQKFAKIQIDANALVAESDGKTLNERIKLLGLDEITQTRLLEVIRERKLAIQDLNEAQQELNRSEFEALKANVALQEEVLKQQKERGANLALIQRTLAEKTLQLEIDNLQKKLGLVEKGSEEELMIKQELNDKLIQQDAKRVEKEKKKQEEIQQAALAAVRAFAEKRSEALLSSLDKQISAVQQRQDQLRELASKGTQDADENLATEQKKLAELEAQRERAIRNQKRLQLGLSAIETYSAKVNAGEPNPIGSTIKDITLLQALINALPTFYSGTERVADSATPTLSTAIDSYLIRADGNERILTGAQNSMIGKMSNQELANLAQRYQSGQLNAVDSALAEKLDTLISIEKSKPVYLGRDYDATERAVTDTIAYQGRIERNKKRVGRLF